MGNWGFNKMRFVRPSACLHEVPVICVLAARLEPPPSALRAQEQASRAGPCGLPSSARGALGFCDPCSMAVILHRPRSRLGSLAPLLSSFKARPVLPFLGHWMARRLGAIGRRSKGCFTRRMWRSRGRLGNVRTRRQRRLRAKPCGMAAALDTGRFVRGEEDGWLQSCSVYLDDVCSAGGQVSGLASIRVLQQPAMQTKQHQPLPAPSRPRTLVEWRISRMYVHGMLGCWERLHKGACSPAPRLPRLPTVTTDIVLLHSARGAKGSGRVSAWWWGGKGMEARLDLAGWPRGVAPACLLLHGARFPM